MPEEKKKLLWDVIGETVQGATHVRAGLTNQDSIDWRPEGQASSTIWLAVSDGHGSAKSFRSDIGSKLATTTAVKVLGKFVDDINKLLAERRIKSTAEIKTTGTETLPKALVRSWLQEVEKHFQEELPFTEEDKDKLGTLKPEMAYGATLITVIVAETYIFYLQLGDGDILVVNESGQVTRPLEGDARLFANETTSLCLPKAWEDFRIGFQTISDKPPVFILAATDGYSNSFRDEGAFKKVGSDIFDMMCEPGGTATVKANLKSWLNEATNRGSGDDISVGIIYREPPSRPSVASGETPEVTHEETPQPSSEVAPQQPVDRNAPTPEKLRAILRMGVLEDKTRREGMLRDIFSEKREVSLLLTSLKERIPQRLSAQNGVPVEQKFIELTKKLTENIGLSEENARWAVKAWVEALGLSLPDDAEVAVVPELQGAGADKANPGLVSADPSSETGHDEIHRSSAGEHGEAMPKTVFFPNRSDESHLGDYVDPEDTSFFGRMWKALNKPIRFR